MDTQVHLHEDTLREVRRRLDAGEQSVTIDVVVLGARLPMTFTQSFSREVLSGVIAPGTWLPEASVIEAEY